MNTLPVKPITPTRHFTKQDLSRGTMESIDAPNGYHNDPIHSDDRHLTIFITPWDRYRYMAAPHGYIA